ncbi:hypothetical protein NNQ28_21830 (plasmid) [Cronobacter dublinensis]|uniref:hypothetical protein n=1 Tax=Cronobacter dublinensis TaxID=413497 RepID=UPI0029307298|nr:hypothetical protein [Cronobacter dublinensis]WNY85063.1 hypothetical protein NNQ28_21830 [Cronobacter dublinensis]
MEKDKSVDEMLSDFNELEAFYIIPFLKKEFGVVDSACFLYQAIDQGVDIYAYLVNGKHVIEFDLPKIDNTIVKNEIISLEEYMKTIQGKGKAKKNARDVLKDAIDKSKIID